MTAGKSVSKPLRIILRTILATVVVIAWASVFTQLGYIYLITH